MGPLPQAPRPAAHISALARQIVGNGPPQPRIGDVMGRIGGVRQVAARELVLALGAGLDALEPVRDRIVDRLIVAELEMQERMMLDRAPVAAVERVRADEIDRAGDPAAGARAITSRMRSRIFWPTSEKNSRVR